MSGWNIVVFVGGNVERPKTCHGEIVGKAETKSNWSKRGGKGRARGGMHNNSRLDVILDLRAHSPECLERFAVRVIKVPVLEKLSLLPRLGETRPATAPSRNKTERNGMERHITI